MNKKNIEKNDEIYFSSTLRGINEIYHLNLRKNLISKKGGKNALEIGCGAGDWTIELCNKYHTLDVIEQSSYLLSKAIKACKKINPKCQITGHQLSIEKFKPKTNQKWQHIYLTFILEHLENPSKILRKITTLLEKDGKLFIAVPNAFSLHRVLAFRMKLIKSPMELSKNDLSVGHRRVYTKILLRKQLKNAGFKIIKEMPIGIKFTSLAQMEKWDPNLVEILSLSGDLCPENSAYIGIVAGL